MLVIGNKVQSTEVESKYFNSGYNTFALKNVSVISEVPTEVKNDVNRLLEENELITSLGLFIVDEEVYVTIGGIHITVLGIWSSDETAYIELKDSELLQSLSFNELVFN